MLRQSQQVVKAFGIQINKLMRAQEILREHIDHCNNTGFATDDLMQILEAHEQGLWSQPQTYDQILAEAVKQPVPMADPNQVVFKRADPLYYKTKELRIDHDLTARNSLHRFMALKRQDPLAPVGRSDRLFVANGYFGQAVPGIRHAHLSGNDLNLVYRIQGRTIYLYGFFKHDELGTGMPPSKRMQQSMAAQLANTNWS